MLGKVASKCLGLVLCAGLSVACSPDYSPDTYVSAAAQKANKVDQGVIVGVRAVQISADPTLGATTGAAAGGIVGSQVGEGGAASALGALGGSVTGGLVGNAVAHASGDAFGYEYIVRKPNGDLLSVTQQDAQPLGIGAHVLIIEGTQARVVPDYTVPIMVEGLHPGDKPNAPPGDMHPAATAKPPTEAPAKSVGGIVATPLAPPGTASDDKKPVAAEATPAATPAPAAAAPAPASPADVSASSPPSGTTVGGAQPLPPPTKPADSAPAAASPTGS